VDSPKYKDFILTLIFVKKLSDVFNDELLEIDNDIDVALKIIKNDHTLVRFNLPKKAR